MEDELKCPVHNDKRCYCDPRPGFFEEEKMEDELISDLQEIITDISNFGEMNQLQIDQYCEEILTLIRKREKELLEKLFVALDKYYVDCYDDGSYPCDPSGNQIIDAIRQDIQQLKEVEDGKTK
jgi:polyhydroxyalkanoate synthesis regulator phasin